MSDSLKYIEEDFVLEPVLSIESPVKMRVLRQYVEDSQSFLSKICVAMDRHSLDFRETSKGLRRFCMEADSWGFDSIYEIAQRLQLLLLKCCDLSEVNGFEKAIRNGLATLSILLKQCEPDFRLRVSTADALDCLNKALIDFDCCPPEDDQTVVI